MKTDDPELIRLRKNIGGVLLSKRLEAAVKIPQWEIADDVGISQKYYGIIERGEKMPSYGLMWKLAKAYGMTLSELTKLIENY